VTFGVPVDLQAYLDRWAALHGGYDPRTSVWSRTWLRLTFRLAAPLARSGMSPHLLTAAGLLAAALVPSVAYAGYPLLAVPLIALSGLFDSLDGAVAVLAGRATPFGYVLDSAADRVGEAAYVVALWVLGAPGWVCALAGAGAWLLEYVRARAVGAGMTGIGLVTVWERATRIAVTAAGLLLVPWFAAAAAVTAGAWSVLGLAGLGQLLVVVHRELPPRSGGALRGPTPGR
jgi:CDP-diacylglycerol--glycerol-3-phosphate 3-phosphatidyltransferase